jgi:hypothetical protein
MFPLGGLFSLFGCWVGVRLSPPLPATSAFSRSIITSMLALFVAAITAICLLYCSCSIANTIACDSPSSSAAAVSWARSAASLKRDFCHRCGVLFQFQPLVGELRMECCPCLLRCGLVFQCNHLVFCKHFAVPHLRSCCHCFLLLACFDSAVAQ